MNTSPGSFVVWLVRLLAAALLSACATGMGKDECAAADWRTIGYEDGLHGFPADRIGAHRVACAKHQVTPDLAAYMEGRAPRPRRVLPAAERLPRRAERRRLCQRVPGADRGGHS